MIHTGVQLRLANVTADLVSRVLKDLPVLLVPLAKKAHEVSLVAQAKLVSGARWAPQGNEESQVLLVLWDLLERLDRMGRLELREYQDLRAQLVRLELRGLPDLLEQSAQWVHPELRDQRVFRVRRAFPASKEAQVRKDRPALKVNPERMRRLLRIQSLR